MKSSLKKWVLAALFLALTYVLPFLTGQIQSFGQMLLPMHIPVMLCGIICGWRLGLLVGLLAPFLRSLTLGMPPLYPGAIAMSAELLTYGAVIGLLYEALPKKTWALYAELLLSMLAGRIVWALMRYLLTFLGNSKFSWQILLTSGFIEAWPGMVLQLILIPGIILALQRFKLVPVK